MVFKRVDFTFLLRILTFLERCPDNLTTNRLDQPRLGLHTRWLIRIYLGILYNKIWNKTNTKNLFNVKKKRVSVMKWATSVFTKSMIG